jgi:chromosome partitioning protein
VNLAVGLAKSGEHTLLVDLDPQCNATSSVAAKPVERHPLVGFRPISESTEPTATERLSVLPGCRSFQDIAALAAGEDGASRRLSDHLAAGVAAFDYVLIDCPPSLGSLTETALAASTEVLMPIQCEYFAMEGLAQMIETIGRVIRRKQGRLGFAGIVLTMVDESLELTKEVDDEVREFFGEIVYETVIPRDVAVSEAPSHGRSVIEHSPMSRGSRAYVELCMEVLGRE